MTSSNSERLWEIELALSALDTVLRDQKAAYVSSEITTGRRLFLELERRGLKSPKTLKDQIGREVYRALIIEPNILKANEFAVRVRGLVGDRELVVSPGPFSAPGWSQRDYLSFWGRVIISRVHTVFFNDGWEYSAGCVHEYGIAAHQGIPRLDARGEEIDLASARHMVEKATVALRSAGIEMDRLEMSPGWLFGDSPPQ